jgi:predicted enzyme related to lactoylglutathione lyase
MPTRDTPWPAGTPCWLDLAVPDVRAATEFYGPVIGWTFLDTGEDFGHYTMCQVNDRVAAAIGPLQAPGQPSFWTIYLASDDLDSTAKLIVEHGGTVLAEPFEVAEFGRMLVAQDNTGGTFAVWQAKGEIGVQVYNEPGALVWEDARLTDAEAGKRFYAEVFGYTYEPVPGTPSDYATFAVNGEVAGGIGGLMGAPESVPSHWIAYFGVVDVDASLAAVERGGGTVARGAEVTPFGRMATVVDPWGAVFCLHSELADG